MGILLLKNAISFKTPSTADLVYRKSGSLMSKYVMETGESWRKFHNYIFLKVDMVHPLDASMCHIPSCICRRIRRFPSYCRIYDNTHYLTPPQLRKPAPCTYVGWRTPAIRWRIPLNTSKWCVSNQLIQPKTLDRPIMG